MDPVAGLRRAVASFGRVEVLVGAAALSLHPRNSSRVLRLEATVEIAATGRPAERKSEKKGRKKAKGTPKKTEIDAVEVPRALGQSVGEPPGGRSE